MNASLNPSPKSSPKSKVTNLDVAAKYGMDEGKAKERGYVYKQNPEVKIFGDDGGEFKLRLAINTDQFGRVFQDR